MSRAGKLPSRAASSCTNPVVSKETKELLKGMMEDSKLTNFQRRQLHNSINENRPLPVHCHPTSSSSKRKSSPKKTSNIFDGRSLTVCGKRTKDVIDFLESENQDDVYRPLPGKLITEKDKEMLQNKMAYGEDFEEFLKVKQKRNQHAPKETVVKELDEFDVVLSQIEERREFLHEMRNLGQEKKYIPIIETEISKKVRELEVIDKLRSKQLAKMVASSVQKDEN